MAEVTILHPGQAGRTPGRQAAQGSTGGDAVITTSPRWVVYDLAKPGGDRVVLATDDVLKADAAFKQSGNRWVVDCAHDRSVVATTDWENDGADARLSYSDDFRLALEQARAGQVVEPRPKGLLAELVQAEASDLDADELPPGDLLPETPVESPAAFDGHVSHGRAAAELQPAAVARLRDALRGFDVNALASTDEAERAEAEGLFQALCAQAFYVDNVFGGVESLLRDIFPEKLASRVVATFDAPAHSSKAGSPADPATDAGDNRIEKSIPRDMIPPRQGVPAGGGGGVIDAIVRSPFTFLATGGSLAMEALRKSAKLANDGGHALAKTVRQSSFDIIGKQVNSLHADIVREAQWLRAHGLDGVIDEMKASGLSLRETVAGMDRGGPLEKVGLQFKGLMVDPEFRERYDMLQEKLDRFPGKAAQYVKGGAALGHDVEADTERLFDGLDKAVEGMPSQKKDGGFELMQDRLREMAEKIRELIHNLLGRLVPGKGP